MDLEAALQLADHLIFNKTGQHLTTLQAQVFRGAWQGQKYEQIAEASGCSVTHVKAVGSGIWELLSACLAEEVNKKTFRVALDRYHDGNNRDRASSLTSASDSASPQPSPTNQRSATRLKSVDFPPRENEPLRFPEGPVEIRSRFYIERPPIEALCYETLMSPGALIRIQATHQMGKTSLLERIRLYAQRQDYRVAPINFQLVDNLMFQDLDRFLRWFCARVSYSLRVPVCVNDHWNEMFGSKSSCQDYFESYLLPKLDQTLVLVLDEVDTIFQYPEIAYNFFAILRAWNEEAKSHKIWENLRMVMAYSLDSYILLDITQPPINVGLPIQLPEFTAQQVEQLVQSYSLEWSPAEVERLMSLVGGHPYLIRVSLYHIIYHRLSLEDLWRLAPSVTNPYSSYLQRKILVLEKQPILMNALQLVLENPEPIYLNAREQLKLNWLGLVRIENNKVSIGCELYRQYFSNYLFSKSAHE